ncbi:aldehyde dehydrogenase family protein [Tomitella cavernea]|uniref:Aldehyde dehydrogenase family protein n=1 Tax=Tomitella cavernea TaxID=1387982 RepID=A0ABP9C1X4_9ACTN
MFIDGQWTEAEAGAVVEVINPATEQVIAQVPQAGIADVGRAIAAARRAFDDGPWPRTPVPERARVLRAMAEIMEQRFDELVELNMAEAGSARPLAAGMQIRPAIDHLRDMAERVLPAYQFDRPMLPVQLGGVLSQGIVRRAPFGVAALVTAYNFPFFINVMKLAAALGAGCTTVLKPAPTTPMEAFVVAEIAQEAGLPAGVLNVVTGDVPAAQALTASPDIDIISFTGSDAVGRSVYAQAAPSLTKVLLELGGKSAQIICDDADLAKAVPSVVAGITAHAGQGCSLLTRTLVHRSREDELIALVIAELEKVRVGDPADPATTMGPLISAEQRAKVERLIATGKAEGATLAYGGGRPAGLDRGYFMEPTLFTGVDNGMTIAQEEFFGPVGVVIPFDDDEDAIRIANDSRYGLGGGVRARDPRRAVEIAQRLRTGLVKVNGGAGGISPHSAMGGYKDSGLGREWGTAGLEEFLETQTIEMRLGEG